MQKSFIGFNTVDKKGIVINKNQIIAIRNEDSLTCKIITAAGEFHVSHNVQQVLSKIGENESPSTGEYAIQ